MSDVAKIASGLSKAQVKVLHAGSGRRLKSGRSILRHAKVQSWPSRPSYRDWSLLWTYENQGAWGFLKDRRLSALGLAVRAYLLENHDAAR